MTNPLPSAGGEVEEADGSAGPGAPKGAVGHLGCQGTLSTKLVVWFYAGFYYLAYIGYGDFTQILVGAGKELLTSGFGIYHRVLTCYRIQWKKLVSL